MHYIEIETEDILYGINHNGDFSGDIILTTENKEVVKHIKHLITEVGLVEIRLPFELIKEIVAHWLRDELVRKYEDIDADELFKLL